MGFARVVAFSCATLVCLSSSFATASANVPSEPCGTTYLGDTVQSLRSVEARRGSTIADVVRRSRSLNAATGPEELLERAVTRPCPNTSSQERLQDLAHLDIAIVWSHLLALRAIDAPIYPKPYQHACYLYDLSAVQQSFIDVWRERLATRGTPFSREAVWMALAREPLFPHVASLASSLAHRIGVHDLPTIDSDEDRWYDENHVRHEKLAAQLPQGTICGPKLALWGFPPVEHIDVSTAAIRR